jgi:hypothetical protein
MMQEKLTSLGLGWLPSLMGVIFLLAVAGLIYLVIRFARRKEYVYAVLAVLPLLWLLKFPVMDYQERREYMAKYAPAKAIFDKLCAEQSQPIIKRVVEDVEGVLLLKVRQSSTTDRHRLTADQMWPSAALPIEMSEDDGYIEFFLFDRRWNEWGPPNPGRKWQIFPEIGGAGQRGFRFVDVVSRDGSTRTRVTAKPDTNARQKPIDGFVFSREVTTGSAPRYAVTFEDNLDPDLRKHWIAGTTIKVIDTQTNEVIGQQSFWQFDVGFGNTNGSRSPWLTVQHACPRNKFATTATHLFVDNVLKAKQGN